MRVPGSSSIGDFSITVFRSNLLFIKDINKGNIYDFNRKQDSDKEFFNLFYIFPFFVLIFFSGIFLLRFGVMYGIFI